MRTIVSTGGTVVMPDTTPLLASDAFLDNLPGTRTVQPSLAYGQALPTARLHVMETPTEQWVETLTGLAATGVEIMLGYVESHPIQAHPMVPLLQVTTGDATQRHIHRDVDLLLGTNTVCATDALLHLLSDVASHAYMPKLYAQGNTDFQVTRGLLGVSL